MSEHPSISKLVSELEGLGFSVPEGRVFIDSFGDSYTMSEELLSLIRTGDKRAGASLLWTHEHEGEPPPAPGDIGIVVDWDGTPAFVTRVLRADVVPFGEVSAEFAALEGEGDGSLVHWREAHWSFFEGECRRIGRDPTWNMPVVCCTFAVLHEVKTVS